MLRARRRFVSVLVLSLRNYLRAMSEERVKERGSEEAKECVGERVRV